MNPARIVCPQCQKRLRLPDRRQLGRRAKCPQCGHRFVVDDSPRVAESSPETLEDVRIDVAPYDPHQRWKPSRSRRRKSRHRGWIAAGALFLIGAGAWIWFRQGLGQPVLVDESTVADVRTTQPPVTPTVPNQPLNKAPLRSEGEPIRLFMVPSGAQLLVHFRPAELWSENGRMAELRASLTQDVMAAVDLELRNVMHRDPAAVEEVLLAWILGARGAEPQLAVVVHLAHEELLSDLIEEFGGEPLAAFAEPRVYLKDDRAVLIRDRRTLAFAPRELAGELAESLDTPNVNTTDGILALLEHTDRDRLLTVVFEPAEVQRHLDALFPESTREFASHIMSWFDANAETIAWSIDVGDAFSSEILLRGRSAESSTTVSERVHEQLEVLPHAMVNSARAMNPQRAGFRRIIGRFPAMLEVFRRATLTAVEDRMVRLSTVLPPKAGPNLVLATVLTWDQSTRSVLGSSDENLPSSSPGSVAPRTLAARLQRPVDTEFNRTPLEEAISYIAAEIEIPIEIDGDALRDAGYTKNMPQTFNLGRVAAVAAIRKIVEQYQEAGKRMVLILDREHERAIISTDKFAERNGQAVYEFPP